MAPTESFQAIAGPQGFWRDFWSPWRRYPVRLSIGVVLVPAAMGILVAYFLASMMRHWPGGAGITFGGVLAQSLPVSVLAGLLVYVPSGIRSVAVRRGQRTLAGTMDGIYVLLVVVSLFMGPLIIPVVLSLSFIASARTKGAWEQKTRALANPVMQDHGENAGMENDALSWTPSYAPWMQVLPGMPESKSLRRGITRRDFYLPLRLHPFRVWIGMAVLPGAMALTAAYIRVYGSYSSRTPTFEDFVLWALAGLCIATFVGFLFYLPTGLHAVAARRNDLKLVKRADLISGAQLVILVVGIPWLWPLLACLALLYSARLPMDRRDRTHPLAMPIMAASNTTVPPPLPTIGETPSHPMQQREDDEPNDAQVMPIQGKVFDR